MNKSNMKFYNRENELNILENMTGKSRDGAKMTLVYGRRRIGKTFLIRQLKPSCDMLYFFIARKDEALLCEEFVAQIEQELGASLFGQFNRFRDILGYLLEMAKTRPLVIVLDEFQEFVNINPGIFSEMQNLWDQYKQVSQIHLIINGSVYRLMKTIFESSKEPLFGRADERIQLQPMGPATLVAIMKDYYPQFKNRDLLALYVVTGGVPKYLALLADKGALDFEGIKAKIFRPDSFWLNEGQYLLTEEFGKDYATYFSILSLIAAGKTSRPEMESVVEKSLGGYIDRLINDYQTIKPVKPVLAKPNTKSVKYEITDNFLAFWFRFIFKNRAVLEAENFDYLKEIFERDFNTFAGRYLEKWFREVWQQQAKFTLIGNYWDKKGNEIDLVGVNESKQTITFSEVKMNPEKQNLKTLKTKSGALLKKYPGYQPVYEPLSLEDMVSEIEA